MQDQKDEERYAAEGRRIYLSLLGRNCPDCLLTRYAEAVKRLHQRRSEEEIRIHQGVMDRVGDWEALEMAARWSGRLPILVDKFRIMVLLAETLPENYRDFISVRTRRLWGWAALAVAGVRSVWKLLKGYALLFRYRGVFKNG